MAINSKQKGKNGELEAAHFLSNIGIPAYRSQQYKGTGDSADIRFVEEKFNETLHTEVKRDEHLNVDKALKQAKRDAKPGQLPIVMHRKNRDEWKITLDAEDFWELYKNYWFLATR